MEGVEAGPGAGVWALEDHPGFQPPTVTGVKREIAYRLVEEVEEPAPEEATGGDKEEGEEQQQQHAKESNLADVDFFKEDVVKAYKVSGWG